MDLKNNNALPVKPKDAIETLMICNELILKLLQFLATLPSFQQ